MILTDDQLRNIMLDEVPDQFGPSGVAAETARLALDREIASGEYGSRYDPARELERKLAHYDILDRCQRIAAEVGMARDLAQAGVS